jgi:hypothetical protein
VLTGIIQSAEKGFKKRKILGRIALWRVERKGEKSPSSPDRRRTACLKSTARKGMVKKLAVFGLCEYESRVYFALQVFGRTRVWKTVGPGGRAAEQGLQHDSGALGEGSGRDHYLNMHRQSFYVPLHNIAEIHIHCSLI